MYSLQLELKCKSVLFRAQQWPDFPLLWVHVSPGNKLCSDIALPSRGSWSKWLMTARRQHVMQDTHRTNCWEMWFMTERFTPTARKGLVLFQLLPCFIKQIHIVWHFWSKIYIKQFPRLNIKNQAQKCLWNKNIKSNEVTPISSPFPPQVP